MTPERFSALADAYGADLRRWPAPQREEAERLAARPDLAAVLAQAEQVDRLLAASRAPAPSLQLRGRVLRAAPRPRSQGLRLDWLSGLGLAGACAAGLALGVMIQPAATLDEPGFLALSPYEPLLSLEAEVG